MLKNIKALILLLLISNCGLKPLYSNNYNKETALSLSQIEITPIDSIEGAEIIACLKHILYSSYLKKYKLNITLTTVETQSIIQKNSDILRQNIKLNVEYILIDKSNGIVINSAVFHKYSSYFNNFSPFENINRSQDSLKYLTEAAAFEIRNRLILFFEQN